MKKIYLFIISLMYLQAHAQNLGGVLDPDFADAGKYVYDYGYNDNLTDVKVQPDGKVVAVGTALTSGFAGQLLVTRLNADGSLDTDFADNGSLVLLDFNESYAYDCAILNDGKILVAGAVANPQYIFSVFLMRLHADGSIDDSFGTNGMTVEDIGPADDFAYGMAIDDEGRILVCGKSVNDLYLNVPMVCRFTSEGVLDETFGESGTAYVPVSELDNTFNSISLDSFGNIYAGGHYGWPLTEGGQFNLDVLVAKFLPNGTLDVNFDNDGFVNTPISVEYVEAAMDIEATDDGVFACGYTTQPDFSFDAVILSYNTTGGLISSFGEAGILTFDQNIQDVFYDMEVDWMGNIYAAGTTGGFFFDDRDFLLCRYTSGGDPETEFGTNGVVTTTIVNAFDEANSIAISDTGFQITLAGKGNNGSNNDIAITRYDNAIEDNVLENEVSPLVMWPNPMDANGVLNLTFQNTMKNIRVLDMTGKIVLEQNTVQSSQGNLSLSITDLASGSYVVELQTDRATQRNVLIVP